MANIEKYKDQARKFEQKEQWPKAVEQLLKAIEAMEASPEDDTDLTLYNRVGDIYQRLGDTQLAVTFYERAADRYGEGGFHNNAIALCNKILRLTPGRSSVYLKLGMMFAAKGFMAEAKQNMLEYADRMQKAGQLEEAFKALKAFAEMTSGQDDIWAVLATQARTAAKTEAQKEQVDKLLSEFEYKDRAAQRKSRVSRSMVTGEEIPVEPGPTKDLIFLDLGDTPSPRKSTTRRAPVEPEAPPPVLEIQSTALAGGEEPLPLGPTRDSAPPAQAPAAPADFVLEPTSLIDLPPEAVAPEPLVIDRASPPDVPTDAASVAGLTSGLPLMGFDDGATASPPADLPLLDVELDLPAETAAAPAVEFMDLGEVHEEVPTLASLEARIAAAPDDWDARRRLGEVLLDEGQRERGLAELDAALEGLEQSERLEDAYALTEEILRAERNSIRLHQKRVELSYRQNDRARLVDAYNELADALLRTNDADRAFAVYRRVLEHDPANARARAALDTLAPPPAAPAVPAPGGTRRPAASPPAEVVPEGGFIDLGAFLMEDDAGPKDTRMKVEDEEPTGDEQADFQSMLQAFKKGVAANVGEEDFQSHYDLGVAYKEMGLLDEAIAEFQKALRATEGRLKSSEALGMCFFEKGQFAVAETILRRGLEQQGASDAERLGLLYWLGRAYEEQGKVPEALTSYNRVFGVDINFQDVNQRVSALNRAGA